MTRSVALLALLAIISAGCDSPGAKVQGHARFYNGATPTTTGPRANFSLAATVAPSNGTWLLSPDKITLHLKSVRLTSGQDGNSSAVNCDITYDKSKPGLTSLSDCPFEATTGTFTGVSLVFAGTMDLVINDAVHGFFTTTTGIVTTPPAGGAQTFSFPVPQTTGGEFSMAPFPFPTPLVVADSSTLNVAIVIDGLQFFRVTVNGGAVTLGGGGPNEPQRPDLVAAVGTPAAVEFYSHQAINTGNSFCTFQCPGLQTPNGVMSVSIYYTDATHPTMVGLQMNGQVSICPNLGLGFIGDPRSYIGLDAGGNVAWAMPSDSSFSTYTAEMRIARVSAIGGTTTLYCHVRTGDPSPAGGSYASGAPAIAVPANAAATYVLVAK